jgi:carboxylesterase
MSGTPRHKQPVPVANGQGDPAPFFLPGGPTGVLLIHGWSGSPAEMRGLGGYLAAQGLTVMAVRLPGHGTEPRELFATRWQDWVAACGQSLVALRRRCDTVFVGGLSMGALLSLYLGATARPPVAGVIAMGAPIYLTDWRIRTLPVLKYVMRWHTKGPSDIVDRAALDRLWHYPRLPTQSIHQLSIVTREARRALPQLRAPLLIMQGRHDRTIPPDAGDYIYVHAGSPDKELVFYENSGHCITEDSDREAVWARVYGFIQAHAPVPDPAAAPRT